MTSKPSEKSRAFEAEVAASLQNLGYSIQRNVILEGHSVDMVAESPLPGLGSTRLIVECKYRIGGSVIAQDVMNFLDVFTILKGPLGLSFGLFVANVPFTRHAKVVVQGHSQVRLMTLDELQDATFPSRSEAQ